MKNSADFSESSDGLTPEQKMWVARGAFKAASGALLVTALKWTAILLAVIVAGKYLKVL